MNFGSTNLFGIIVPSLAAAIGTGFTFANAIAAAYSNFSDDIGVSGSIFGGLQIILTVMITYIISTFGLITPQFMACVFAVVFLIGIIALFAKKVARKNTETQPQLQ